MQIEAVGLSKRFGEVTALRDLCFSVPSGRRVALVGPNGSGKSTLNRVLLGLLRFDGEVRVGGASPLDRPTALARRIAYVPQMAPGLSVPVRELLWAVSRLRGIPAEDFGKVGARLGLDLSDLAPRPFRSLSGGMRQKLLIAIALAARPALLVLDEPTGSLDARSRERFIPLFDELVGDATVVLCSHRLEEVRQLVDHVLVLDEGRLVYDGAATDFLGATTTSILEVRAEGDAAARWLLDRGFRRGAGGWWLRTVSPSDKLRLLPEVASALGGALLDLNVHDLEALEIGGTENGGSENGASENGRGGRG